MTTLKNVIETVTIGKYSFQIYKRENPLQYKNKPFAVMYEKATPKGKYSKSKMIEHYVFDSIESAEQYVINIHTRIFKNMKTQKAEMEAKKEAQKTLNASDFFEIGSIIYNSWGYEQTNVDFYQVVRMTAKRIVLKPIAQQMVEGSMYAHGMAHNVLAVKDAFLDNKKEISLTVRPEGRLSGGESYAYYNKWDGSEKYVSSYY